jgi:hypothetical protein
VLEHLYLLPDARRLGIGTMLLDEARKFSPSGLTLHVFQQNSEARAFYGRHGFHVVATSDGSDNMEGLPELVLRWGVTGNAFDDPPYGGQGSPIHTEAGGASSGPPTSSV